MHHLVGLTLQISIEMLWLEMGRWLGGLESLLLLKGLEFSSLNPRGQLTIACNSISRISNTHF